MFLSTLSHRQAGYLVLSFVIFNAVFLAIMPLLPFIDLPNHLAEATIFKFYNGEGNILNQYYEPTPWYFPNVFHPVFCSLFPSVEWGNKVFHILCIVLMQGALFLVIRQLNGNAWYGALGILFTYNYNLTYGFVGFAISISMLLVLFYLTLRDIEKNGYVLKISIAFVLVLLFTMHAQNALLGLALYGLMMLYHHRKSFRKLLLHVLFIPLPLILLIMIWWSARGGEEEGSTVEYLIAYYTSGYLETFAMRFRLPVLDNFQLRQGVSGIAIALFFFLCVIIPVILSRPLRRLSQWSSVSQQVVYSSIFFLSVFLCYMLLPDQLPGQTPLFQRLSTIVMLAFIVCSSLLVEQAKLPWLKGFVISVCVLYTIFWCEYIYSFNRQNRGFTAEFFRGIDNQATMVGLIYDNDYRGRKVYIHFPNYFIVWNHGIAASKIIDYRFGVVRRPDGEMSLPFYHELMGEHFKFQANYDQFDLLLVRGRSSHDPDPHLQHARLYRQAGDWKLFLNR